MPQHPDTTATERALLGAILLEPARWPQTAALAVNDFLLSAHRRIYAEMARVVEDGGTIDLVCLADRLNAQLEEIGGIDYLSALVEHCLPANISEYVRAIKEGSLRRKLARQAENFSHSLCSPRLDRDELDQQMREMAAALQNHSAASVIKFHDIPDIFSLDIKPLDVLVKGMIARKCITMIAGADGVAKSLFALKLCLAVATGGDFLGQRCAKAPVIYCDYENPDSTILERMRLLAGGPIPDLKIWGTWLGPPLGPPPPIGSEILLQMAEEVRPLIVVDPLRYAHAGKENDSDDMMPVMRKLRALAVTGAAVLILHHVSRNEGSNGRGSSVIQGACDIRFVQGMDDKDPSLLTLKCGKTRLGSRFSITIRANYDEGTFEPTDSQELTRKPDSTLAIGRIIESNPGLSQSAICAKVGRRKQKVIEVLKTGIGIHWEARENGNALSFFPITRIGSQTREPMGTDEVDIGSPLYKGNRSRGGSQFSV